MSDSPIDLNSEIIKNSVKDYFYLINRKYPEKGSLKIVGDHYKLTRDERTILYRGISSFDLASKRQVRITKQIQKKKIIIDGYNVIFTLCKLSLRPFCFY